MGSSHTYRYVSVSVPTPVSSITIPVLQRTYAPCNWVIKNIWSKISIGTVKGASIKLVYNSTNTTDDDSPKNWSVLTTISNNGSLSNYNISGYAYIGLYGTASYGTGIRVLNVTLS